MEATMTEVPKAVKSQSRNVNAYVKRMRRVQRLRARYERKHAGCMTWKQAWADATDAAGVARMKLTGAQMAEAQRLLEDAR